MIHRRPRRREELGSDAGVTLIETLVALSLLGVVLTLFTAGVVPMYRAAERVESAGSAQAQLHAAFQRLDREVRYAYDVTPAGNIGGTWYVEYRVSAAGAPTCVGLRLHDTQLQRRTWVESRIGATATAWLPLASGVRAGPAGVPFELLPADATAGVERLRLRLTVGTGTTAAETDVSLTAMNTIRDGTPSTCTEGRP